MNKRYTVSIIHNESIHIFTNLPNGSRKEVIMTSNFTIKGSFTFKSAEADIELNDFEANFSSEMNEREIDSTVSSLNKITESIVAALNK